jgi:lambda repressor-like predicted transcriptional regulator
MTVDEAKAITLRIADHVEQVWELIVEAYQRRAWVALGYESWDAYMKTEFGADRIKLPAAKRLEVVGEMRARGMSTRAIASATGLSKDTVHRAAVSSETPDDDVVDAEIVGIDGKRYAPHRTVTAEDWPEPPVLTPAEKKAAEARAEAMVAPLREICDAGQASRIVGLIQNAVDELRYHTAKGHMDVALVVDIHKVGAALQRAAADAAEALFPPLALPARRSLTDEEEAQLKAMVKTLAQLERDYTTNLTVLVNATPKQQEDWRRRVRNILLPDIAHFG